MTETKEVESGVVEEMVKGPAPVAVGTRVPQQLRDRLRARLGGVSMVNDRASHFYFRRVSKILKSLGKYR